MNTDAQNSNKKTTLDRRAWLAALCCAAPLAACEAPGDEPPTFEDIDSNANGMISVVEAQQNDTVMRDFEQLDTNADGSLDKIEYGALAADADAIEQGY
ncbi:MAG TPA: hypothetical protein VFP95_07395 [Gammaproteobacteria bacterium]|nr:hypothetical protein [Gammaproteobacteria bacterium]